jgi:hypothetical protein
MHPRGRLTDTDGAFAKPEIYEALEARDASSAIRIPANKTLELEKELRPELGEQA